MDYPSYWKLELPHHGPSMDKWSFLFSARRWKIQSCNVESCSRGTVLHGYARNVSFDEEVPSDSNIMDYHSASPGDSQPMSMGNLSWARAYISPTH